MHSFISIIITIFITKTVVISQESEEDTNQTQSLCENSIINSADRLLNNTVRLYRGKYYWELIGLPEAVGHLEGPFKIWYLNMGTIFRNNTVVTLLSGNDKGSVYKTEGMKYWAWNDKGEQFAGALKGNYWEKLPQKGLEAAFHDGNETNPTFVGFNAIRAYYFSTKEHLWVTDNKEGYIGGKNGENFPPDLTAAFSWFPTDPKDEYIVYLFKGDKYCKRTKFLKSGKSCDEWIDNKVLFGCSGGSSGSNGAGLVIDRAGGPVVSPSGGPNLQPPKINDFSGSVSDMPNEPSITETTTASGLKYTASPAFIIISISFKLSFH